MKLAIATPTQAGEGWTPFLTEWLTPEEIRLKFHELVAYEDHLLNEGRFTPDTEVRIVSMNRTVLDQVTSEFAKEVGHLTYEDVLVWKEGRGLVPLLDLHTLMYLCHSRLGSLYERSLL